MDVQWGKSDAVLASASFDHTVAVWDVATQTAVFDAKLDGLVLTVAISPASTVFLSLLLVSPLLTNIRSFFSLFCIAGDQILFAGTSNKQLCMLDRRTPGVVASLYHHSMVNSLYVYRDGSQLMTGDSTGAVCTWDAAGLRVVDSFYNEEAHKPISCINVSNMSDRTFFIKLLFLMLSLFVVSMMSPSFCI